MEARTEGDVLVAALYRFAPVPDPAGIRAPLQAICEASEVVGSLLIAPEGINGTLAGPDAGIETVLRHLRALPGFAELAPKYARCPTRPFHRMKVRLKREIVTMGDEEIDPTQRVGTYVSPRHFDALIDDPEVLVLDTRNHYETRIGTFRSALDPELDNFRDFPRWVKENLDPAKTPKVAMFCTGGIRCEKASSLLLREGFEEVYHLEGGILRYLEDTPPEASQWQGECFVFDQRVSVDAALEPGRHALCHGCLEPVSPEEQADPLYEAGVCCPRCHGRSTEADKQRRRERNRQLALAAERGEAHIGVRRPGDEGQPPTPPDGILYSFRRCPFAMRARLALTFAGLDPEFREVVLADKPPALLELGQTTVPALVLPSGELLGESLAIMEHAHRVRPMPRRPELAAMLETIDQRFKPLLDRAKYPNRFPDEDTSNAWPEALSTLEGLRSVLAETEFLDGDEPGFHDAAIFPFVRQFAGVDGARFAEAAPELEAWRARMASHPWFRSIMKKLGRWREGDRPISFRASLVAAVGQ